MLRPAEIRSTRSYSDYKKFYTYAEAEHVEDLARRLKGKRIVHINATDSGGGVAEILHGLVPFEQSLNISSAWRVLTVRKPFFSVTKKIHNALQGSQAALGRDSITDEEWQLYVEQSRDIAHVIGALRADLLFIHDPQPFLAGSMAETAAQKILRIHIDVSSPDAHILERFMPGFQNYARIIFSLHAYVPEGMKEENVAIIAPAIDPLSEKNIPLTKKDARRRLARFGVQDGAPLVAQVSRFDPWKDPIGVIHAFESAREKIPGLQLVLMGSMQVEDDPEAAGVLKEIQVYTENNNDIIIISEQSDILVNAVQTAADVVMQKSLREGFGLTAAEAMWKYTPVIAGNVGGLRMQIQNGENGFLVGSAEEAAVSLIQLFGDSSQRKAMGERAHETVRERFLLPREASDHLQLYADVLGV